MPGRTLVRKEDDGRFVLFDVAPLPQGSGIAGTACSGGTSTTGRPGPYPLPVLL